MTDSAQRWGDDRLGRLGRRVQQGSCLIGVLLSEDPLCGHWSVPADHRSRISSPVRSSCAWSRSFQAGEKGSLLRRWSNSWSSWSSTSRAR